MTKPDHTLKLNRRRLATTGAAATAGVAVGIPAWRAVAQDQATPVDNTDLSTPELDAASTPPPAAETDGPPIPEGTTLVADGLSNPRFIARGSDGTLYVTEVGVGGDEPFGVEDASGTGELDDSGTPGATPVVSTPAAVSFEETRGYTGMVSSIGLDGTRTVLVDGLASYGSGIGVQGIALGAGEVYFAIGGVAVGAGADPLPEENTIYRYSVDTGEVTTIASLGQFEVDENPDGTDINPNLYEISHAPEGNLVVVDAGGNTVYNVDIATGEFSLAGVVPDYTELTGQDLDPELGSGQAVPTGVDVTQDGTIYISPLREFWPPESPSLLTMGEDGTFTPVEQSEPFQWTVALEIGPDGNLYASELFGAMTEQGPGPGRVTRLNLADGTVETILDDVPAPHGIVFDDEGNMYVVIYSMGSAPGAPMGMVVRMDGVAAIAS